MLVALFAIFLRCQRFRIESDSAFRGFDIGFSLVEDHKVILDQMVAALEQHQPDLFIIAGDVFDRPAQPASALRQFNQFLTRARQVCDAAIVMIAGNHDSGDRIEAMAIMADPKRDLIRGVLRADEPPLILQDTGVNESPVCGMCRTDQFRA